jgi:ribonuclease J
MFIYNKDLQEMLEYLKAVGYEVPSKYIVTEREFNNSMKDIVVIISSQGPVLFNMIHNIANNEDDLISMDDQDVICMASRVIAGTGKDFAAMENDIYKLNAELIVLGDQVINMHPSVEDLKMMLFILRPKYYIPVKGQYRQLYMNAELAMNMGYSPSNILILDNGQVAQFENGRLVSCRMEFDLKDVLVDGKKNWDMAGVVLKDRETLSTDGVIILAIGIDAKTKKIINGPDIQTRGLIYLKDAEYITKDVAKIMEETIENDVSNKKYDNMETRQAIRDKVSRYLLRQTAKRPMILPVIMEINT